MAALSNSDLVKILGENARLELIDKEKTENPLVVRRKALESIEGQQFSAFALILMGIVLLISAWYTAAGQAFIIQTAVAGAAIVGGLGWNVFLNSKKRAL